MGSSAEGRSAMTFTRLQRPIPGGLLIAVEGIDGVGKTKLGATAREALGEPWEQLSTSPR